MKAVDHNETRTLLCNYTIHDNTSQTVNKGKQATLFGVRDH